MGSKLGWPKSSLRLEVRLVPSAEVDNGLYHLASRLDLGRKSDAINLICGNAQCSIARRITVIWTQVQTPF